MTTWHAMLMPKLTIDPRLEAITVSLLHMGYDSAPGRNLFNATCTHILKKHTGAVLNVEFTENGTYCISTSQDKTLVLWNPAKGLPIKQYSGPHNHEISNVTISADNARFASCGGDKAAFLWDVTTGDVIRKFPGHEGKINCCTFAARDDILFTGCYDKLVRAFDVRAYQHNKPIQCMAEARDTISSVMVVDNDRFLVTSIDGAARCYDMRKGRISEDQFPTSLLRGALTHDNRCYVVNALDDQIRLVELGSGQLLNTFRGHKSSNYMLNAQFTPDDAFVVSGSEDGRIYIWDICTMEGRGFVSASQNDGGTSEAHKSRPSQVLLPCSLEENRSVNFENNRLGGCVFAVRCHPRNWLMLSCHNDRVLRVWKRQEVGEA